MRSSFASWRSSLSIWRVFILQLLVVLVFLLPFVSATFRDNDQAALVSGAWQIAQQQAPFFHGAFYNFDKQWGTFLALTLLYRSFPRANPVLLGNILLALVVALSWLSLGIRMGRTRRPPLSLVLPVLLSPALLLYMPFLGTGWMSLAWLLLAFFFLGWMNRPGWRWFGVLLVAVAAACRGDVVLAVPALGLSLISRRGLAGLLRTGSLWALAAAAILPVLLGKWMAGTRIPDTNPFSFDLRAYTGFFLFGLTPAVLLLLGATVWTYLHRAARRKQFLVFYGVSALAPLIPLTFYSLQLYTLRYFFLTIASLLFLLASRRSVWLYRAALMRNPRRMRQFAAFPLALTLGPWVLGWQLPTISQPRLTVSDPTRFPTGDGVFPMGAYFAFAWQERFQDHLAIDHNQKIWIAARQVAYRGCDSGEIPFLITPMSNFIELAIRLQGKRPLPIASMNRSPCGVLYVDARSLLRSDRAQTGSEDRFNQAIHFASTIDDGQIIVRIDRRASPTVESALLRQIHDAFGYRSTEIYLERADIPWTMIIQPGIEYRVFSDAGCRIGELDKKAGAGVQLWNSPNSVSNLAMNVNCKGTRVGWTQASFPGYMGL